MKKIVAVMLAAMLLIACCACSESRKNATTDPSQAETVLPESILDEATEKEYNRLLDAAMEDYPQYKDCCNYSLYDIEKDGVPELFLKTGTSEADLLFHVYAMSSTDNTAVELGTVSGANTALCGVQEEGSFLLHYCDADHERIGELLPIPGSFVSKLWFDGQVSDYHALTPVSTFALDDRTGLLWQNNEPEDNRSVLDSEPGVSFPQFCMTPELAKSYADLIRNDSHPIVRAAIFDGGGVPMLWIAHGNSISYGETGCMIDGDYGDSLYTCADGNVQECTWMTTILRAGENGVAVQVSGSFSSEFDDVFKMFYIHHGKIDEEPFATGVYGPGGATLNEQYYGSFEQYPTALDIYQEAEYNLHELLDARSGAADMLFLNGACYWLDRDEALAVLESYEAMGGYSPDMPYTSFYVWSPEWIVPIYQEASVTSDVTSYLMGSEMCLIEETSGNMGRLSTGEGWVDLTTVMRAD